MPRRLHLSTRVRFPALEPLFFSFHRVLACRGNVACPRALLQVCLGMRTVFNVGPEGFSGASQRYAPASTFSQLRGLVPLPLVTTAAAGPALRWLWHCHGYHAQRRFFPDVVGQPSGMMGRDGLSLPLGTDWGWR